MAANLKKQEHAIDIIKIRKCCIFKNQRGLGERTDFLHTKAKILKSQATVPKVESKLYLLINNLLL